MSLSREKKLPAEKTNELSDAIKNKKYDIAMNLIPLYPVNHKVKEKSLLEMVLDDRNLKDKNFEVATQLINAGANVNAKTSQGDSLLIKFMDPFYDKKIALFLIQNGADMSALSNDGSTVLMEAVMMRREDLVDFILEEKPDNLNDKNAKGETALYIAASEGKCDKRYLKMLAALIKAEADPYFVCPESDGKNFFELSWGFSQPFISAYQASLKQKVLAQIALEKNARVTPLIEKGQHPIYRSQHSVNTLEALQLSEKLKIQKLLENLNVAEEARTVKKLKMGPS